MRALYKRACNLFVCIPLFLLFGNLLSHCDILPLVLKDRGKLFHSPVPLDTDLAGKVLSLLHFIPVYRDARHSDTETVESVLDCRDGIEDALRCAGDMLAGIGSNDLSINRLGCISHCLHLRTHSVRHSVTKGRYIVGSEITSPYSAETCSH